MDIYSWLPFTQQGLAAAAAVTQKFLVDYNTYSYTESAADYVARMNGLITTEEATTLKGLYATPGVAKIRTDQKQVSTGTAVDHRAADLRPVQPDVHRHRDAAPGHRQGHQQR